jgi:lactoylglutathione lyase
MKSPYTIQISCVDHIGVRVKDLTRALDFYRVLGFELHWTSPDDAVAIIRNARDVEINLIYNANNDGGGRNILMDVSEKYPGYTHIALRVESIADTIEALRSSSVRITQGPVSFGGDGHISVFVRDPDLNVVELRGREQELSSVGGVTSYEPQQ